MQLSPFQRHSPTSLNAAIGVTAKAPSLKAQVLAFIVQSGSEGLTDEEMQASIDANTQRPRRVELVAEGEVVDSGRTRPTAHGKSAVVWVAKQFRALS